VTSSSRRLEVHFKCEEIDIVSRFERIDSENFIGSIHEAIKSTPPRKVNETLVAKWIGSFPEKAGTPKVAGTQLMAARIIRQGNDYYSLVDNRSGSPMTGYAISILMYGIGQRIRHKPGTNNQEAIRGIVLGANPLAAVFADGGTFGDAKQVSDLMNRQAHSASRGEFNTVPRSRQANGNHCSRKRQEQSFPAWDRQCWI
jgi:hypothetical protein